MKKNKSTLSANIVQIIKDNGGTDPLKTKGAEHRTLEQDFLDSLLSYEDDAASQTEIEAENTTEVGKYVSPFIFWRGIAKFLTGARSWVERQVLQKGINLGDNATPANGDIYFRNNTYRGRRNNVDFDFITSLGARFGTNVCFVSKQGDNATAQVGSLVNHFSTFQAAVNASNQNTAYVLFHGDYPENVYIASNFNTSCEIFGIGRVSIQQLYVENGTNRNITNVTIGNLLLYQNVSPLASNSYKIKDCTILAGAIGDFAAGAKAEFINCTLSNILLAENDIEVSYFDCTFSASTLNIVGFSSTLRYKFNNCTFAAAFTINNATGLAINLLFMTLQKCKFLAGTNNINFTGVAFSDYSRFVMSNNDGIPPHNAIITSNNNYYQNPNLI